MFTPQEVDQYIRLTLKQWGVSHLTVEWFKSERVLGLACVYQNKIKLNVLVLKRFTLFDEVLKHEIAHFLAFEANGKKFLRKNNRWQLHGADFKAQCRRMKIPARSRIPA